MVAYLSAAWLDEATVAVANSPEVQALGGMSLRVVVEAGDTVYSLSSGGGRVQLSPGTVDNPTLRITQSADTAAAIATGAGNAQTEFVRGDVRLIGSAQHLVDARPLLEAVGHALAPLRATTEYR